MRTYTIALLLFLTTATACKGCNKEDGDADDGGNTENPGIEELVLEVCGNRQDDDEDGLTDCETPFCRTHDTCAFTPPSPDEIAPPVDPTNLTGFVDSVRFLWEGDEPVIGGVDPNALHTAQVGVLRARVVDASGEPIEGVMASVAGRPGLGYTFSRSDGAIDLVANGGSRVTVRTQAPGFLAVDRTVDVRARDHRRIEDVVLTPLDERVNRIDAGGLAEGTTTADDDGERTARLWFPDDTVATVHLPDGQKADLTSFDVRLTEYTVGDTGPQAMPAFLPDESAYTYAAELSIDEAEAVGAEAVTFDKTAWLYLDNFLDFDLGAIVPTGIYSRGDRRWESSENGRVVRLTANGLEAGDTDLQVTSDELASIRRVYSEGDVFWRVPIRHFSPIDCNWPQNAPPGAELPPVPDFSDDDDPGPCHEGGSLIECQNQTLVKVAPLPGTPHSLVYRSDRTIGRDRGFELQLTGDPVNNVLEGVVVEVEVLGRRWVEEFEPEPNLTFTFEWDGRDAFGREVSGRVPATVAVGFVYTASYSDPAQSGNAFAQPGGDSLQQARQKVTIWNGYSGHLGSFDALGFHNMGGWALDGLFAYDGGDQILYDPGAPSRSAADISRIIEDFDRLDGLSDLNVDLHQDIIGLADVRSASDGSLFLLLRTVSSTTAIVRRSPDGEFEHWAGRPTPATEIPVECADAPGCGAGDPRRDAILFGASWFVTPDDTIYLATRNCLQRITDTVENVAGRCMGEEEVPEFDAIAQGPSGDVYAWGSRHIYAVDTETGSLETRAGCDDCFDKLEEDRGDAMAHYVEPHALVVDGDGDVLFFDSKDTLLRLRGGELIRQPWQPDGGVTLASSGADGAVYFFDEGSSFFQLKRLVDGEVVTIAGSTDFPPSQDELDRRFRADQIPASDALIFPLGLPLATASGDIYFGALTKGQGSDDQMPVIKRIGSVFPSTVDGNDATLPSTTGRWVRTFSADGRLQRVQSAWNGLTTFEFEYDEVGLRSIVDRYGTTTTTIERDADGGLAAIVGPDGQRTEFTLDPNGYVAEISYPDGSTRRATTTDRGLLTEWKDGVGAISTYTYDVQGKLVRAEDAEGAWKTLTATGSGIALDTSSGRHVEYSGSYNPLTRTSTVIDPAGLVWTTQEVGGLKRLEQPDGTIREVEEKPGPRFGLQVPYVTAKRTVTPAGLEQTTTRSREVTLDDPRDLTSVASFTETTDINGNVTTYSYDGATKTMTRTSPEGRTAVYRYDDFNHVNEIAVGDFEPTTFSFDDVGRLAELRQGDSTIAAEYGADGQLSRLVTPDGSAAFEWDDSGRLIRGTTGAGHERAFAYDTNGRPASITTDTDSTYSFDYTSHGRLTSFEHPSGDADTHSWTDDRTLASGARANGMTFDVTRDDAFRVVGWTTGRGTTSRTIDETTGQTVRSETPDGAVDLKWDGFLNTRREIAFEGQTHVVERELDDDFQVAQRTVDGIAVGFEYDDDLLVTRAGQADVTWTDHAPALSSVAVRGIDTEYVYDSRGRLESLRYHDGRNVLYEATYTYDASSRRATAIETIDGATTTIEYDYDADGQLVGMTRDGSAEASFAYDPRGNRTTIVAGAATYDDSDRLVSAGPRTYAVDASGFVTSWNDGAATTLEYDHYDLVRVTTPTAEVEYGYDSLGRRLWRRVDGAFDRGWIYDDTDRPVAEVDANGDLVSRFVYATEATVPTYMERDGRTYRFVTEPNGSVRLVVDAASGDVLQRIDYDALGDVVADSNPGVQPFGFAAGLYDPETELVRFGVRDYDPFTGRFTAPEPRGFGGQHPNLYVYARNDAVNFVDPHGDLAHAIWLVIVFTGTSAGATWGAVTIRDDVASRWNGRLEEASNARAQEIAERNGLTTQDAENAMRHCTRTCDYKRHGLLGEWITGPSNSYHEVPLPLPDAGGWENREGGKRYHDRKKDEFNNECGEFAAEQPGSCLDNCQRFMQHGRLATDKPIAPDNTVDPAMSVPSFGGAPTPEL